MAVHRETWTDEKVATLQRLYSAGEPSSRIASAVGMTRNAVIGKTHRMGLARPPKPPVIKAAQLPRPKAIRETRVPSPPPRLPSDPSERQELFNARADKALDRFDVVITGARGDAPGVRFLDRGLYQCATPLPGWEDAHVTEKMVCGQMVALRRDGVPTSYCPACSRVMYAAPSFQAFKDRGIGVPA